MSTSVLGPSILSGETVKETVSGFQEASGKGASSCLSHLPLEGKYSVHLDYITAQRRWGHCHQLSASGPRGVSLFLKKKKKKRNILSDLQTPALLDPLLSQILNARTAYTHHLKGTSPLSPRPATYESPPTLPHGTLTRIRHGLGLLFPFHRQGN